MTGPLVSPETVGRVALVTGGAGYLGRAIARRLLDAGVRVKTIDLRAESPDPRALHLAADLRDHDAIAPHFEGVDVVFHTAALISTVDATRAQPALARAVHTQDASYLDVIHDDIHDELDWNPSDYAYQLTRRARGLPLWFSLSVHGSNAYRDAIERVLAVARAAAARIREVPHLELVREPELSIVMFRRLGWSQADYDAWSARLLDEQIAFVTPSSWHGEPIARLAFLHPETTLAIVDEVLATTA